jgi:CARDB
VHGFARREGHARLKEICIMRTTLAGIAAFLSFACIATAASAAPDLQPIPSRLAFGVVSVRNTGASTAGPSVVTINCHKPAMVGGCVDIPAVYVPRYTNPAYPNRLVVRVPRIAAGHVYNHTLPFWGSMVWPSGTYDFDFVADAGATVAESNEANNTGTYVKVVP